MGTTTAISAVRTIYNHLITRGAKAATSITGEVYWLSRPKNSDKEDIVIGALAMNADQAQEGVFNVNIHVPNLQLGQDNTQPNFTRLEAISAILVPMLADVWGYDWNFDLDEPATPVPDGDSWFCNIRIRFWTLRQ
jgi:hypothetical protein